MGNEKNKILIVQTAFIGDVILITPLIKAVRELYPSAELDVMVIPQTAGVLKNNPNIDKIILFDKRENKVLSFIKTLLQLRKNKYNIAITPHSSMTTALLLYYAGIPMRIGFDRWKAAKYLTHKVPHPKGIHKTKKNLSLLTILSDKKFLCVTKEETASTNVTAIIGELGHSEKCFFTKNARFFTKNATVSFRIDRQETVTLISND